MDTYNELPAFYLAEYPEARIPLPAEPLYEMALVAALIPCTYRTLQSWLTRHKAELSKPYYRVDAKRLRHRLIPASDVRWLRARYIRRGSRAAEKRAAAAAITAERAGSSERSTATPD